MSISVSGASAASADPRHARRWWILGVIAVAQLMIVLDNTVVNIALPSAQNDLGFSDSGRQWVVTAYALAFGSLLLFGGRLSDLLGRRRALIIAVIGFAVVSGIAGAAPNFGLFITARAVQGVFGALLGPTNLALLTTTFQDPKDRAKAFGVFGAVAGGGGAVGLLVGGALTEYLDWRWCLYINVVIAIIALIGIFLFIAPGKTHGRNRSLDLPGTILITAGLFCLVYGFGNKATYDWSSPMVWLFAAVAVVLLVAFVFWEIHVKHPLLPMLVVFDRTRGASFLTLLISASAMFGVFLFNTYYVEGVLGYSPVKTGVAFLPMIFGVIVASQLSVNIFVMRFGYRVVAPMGFIIAGIGLLFFAQMKVDSSYVSGVLPGLLITGFGFGTIFPAGVNGATLGVYGEHAGVGSALVNACQQVGGSIGTAVYNSIALAAATSYATAHVGALKLAGHALPADKQQEIVTQITSGAQSSVPATHDPQELAFLQQVKELAFSANVHSYTRAYSVAAVVLFVSAVLLALLFRSRKADQATMAEMTARAKEAAEAPQVEAA